MDSSLRSTSLASASSMESDAENLCATELRLGLPGTSSSSTTAAEQLTKKPSSAGTKRALETSTASEASGTAGDEHDAAAPSKAQVVGWPPVRASRRSTFLHAAAAASKKSGDQQQQQQQGGGGLYVKVSMDGAPYLRKVDLRVCKGYKELRDALDVLFTNCFSAEGCSTELAIAYEDKDGDLMLVGDVPWDMFISSCKKLRIMKGSEAR